MIAMIQALSDWVFARADSLEMRRVFLWGNDIGVLALSRVSDTPRYWARVLLDRFGGRLCWPR